MGDSVEHVFDVKEEEGSGWGDTEVTADLDTSRMDDMVKAAFDGCAELALWEEDSGKLGTK